MNEVRVYLPDIVGRGYKEFWDFKGRYRVCKGSRASKKSKTTALNLIYRLMKYPQSNLLVVRRYYATLKDSCYTELKWAIHRLGVDKYFICRQAPLEIIYKPTGQRIYFRGLDNSLKITSITVENGVLCWLWIEEAYEVEREADFDVLDESIRGEVGKGLFKQITLTFNPWNERHWLKKRFFDKKNDNVLALTTNYLCNEWLDDADLRLFEDMRVNNPRRYQVAGLGEWGVTDGLIYENWIEKSFDVAEIMKMPSVKAVFGLDFGYCNDPTALFCGLCDKYSKTIWVYDEIYKKGMSNEAIYKAIADRGYQNTVIRADSAEPKSIARLKELGLKRIRAARKGKDSIANGIDFISDYKLIIHPKCSNFLREISEYKWCRNINGRCLNQPEAENDHLMDAMRYAVEGIMRGEGMTVMREMNGDRDRNYCKIQNLG